MDVFTTVLAKIRTTPIKPEKLRVKSLRKEAATRPLADDINHVEDHELCFIAENQDEQEKPNHNTASANEEAQHVKAKEPDILHKQDITKPKKNKPDEETEHLDIYI